jgi:hypothetical protein
MVVVYTIDRGKEVAKILKLAQRAVRQAMMTKSGDDHIAAVRAQLDLLSGTNADTIAKAIIDIVKTDAGE